MAARRLIAVLVVLFAVSIAAAAVAPDRRSPLAVDDESPTSTTDPADEPASRAGDLLTATIEASEAAPPTVRAGIGDQLDLAVSTRKPLQVGLPDLGLLGEATPDAPARFDVLLRGAGELTVIDIGRDEVIGRLLVAERPSSGETAAGPKDIERSEQGEDGGRAGSG